MEAKRENKRLLTKKNLDKERERFGQREKMKD